MTGSLSVIDRIPQPEIFPFKLVTRFVNVRLHYEYVTKDPNALTQIIRSKDAEQCFRTVFDPNQIALQESFYCMLLNRAHRVIAILQPFVGATNHCVVDIKIIVMHIIALNAQSIILCHNHPSGNLQPSTSDRELTIKVKHTCGLLDVRLFDHIILAPGDGYYSFVDQGDL